MQPDTIISEFYNPQSLNRYSYVNNNPIRYNDPTGHIECNPANDDGCDPYTQKDKINDLKLIIKDRFNWTVKEKNWRLKELETIYQVGSDIEEYIDKLTGGKGNEWMRQHLGNTTIVHASWGDSHAETYPTKWLDGSTIYLGKNWLNDPWSPEVVFAHEVGHVWDINSSFAPSYLMNLDLGGPGACLFCAPGNGVPKWGKSYHYYFKTGDAYGNSGRNEYFAEAFAAAIYNRGDPGVVNSAVAWVDNNIPVPLYFNPWTGQR